ncbi:Cyclic di-GMP phosphodiesterase Gmr [Thalassocella blandensis]|nr:Cyclic di-GMP phosphodiesterase Gmr [Thalassocella blandensis]
MQESQNYQPKLLIVDDIPNNIQSIHEAIRGLGEVHFATNGRDALSKINRINPDIVLLDIEMPGMDGYEVCRRIKSAESTCHIPIIFITSHDSESNEMQALDAGAVDFIEKPIHPGIARKRVDTHLSLQLKTRQLDIAQKDLSNVFHSLPAFIAHWSADGECLFCNDIDGAWFEIRSDAMLGKSLSEIFNKNLSCLLKERVSEVLDGGSPCFEVELPHSFGIVRHCLVSLTHRRALNGKDGFLMLITDITERRHAEIALQDEKEKIRVMLHSIGDAVIATDAAGVIEYVNPIAEDLTGWLASEAVGRPIEEVMLLREGNQDCSLQNPIRFALKDDRRVGMAMNSILKCRDGKDFHVEDSASPIKNSFGQTTGAIIVFHDVSEARAMAMKMSHLANHDPLTNLPNRMLLQDRTEQAIKKSNRNNSLVGLMLIDIDNFKTINDALGHSVGDELLINLSKRIESCVFSGETVSRQGGDEFTVLVPDVESAEGISKLANDILDAISEPFLNKGKNISVNASVGISLYPSDSASSEDLYRHADAAMYAAKNDGKNRFHFFAPEIEEELHAKHVLEQHLRESVTQGVFELMYQPKIDTVTESVIGVEALVRLKKGDTYISPGEFIPLAEETGLIIPLGKSILYQAFTDARRWHLQGMNLQVAVNISLSQFSDENFVPIVRQLLKETGVDPSAIELELTESILAKNVNLSITKIKSLKSLGFKIAVDDFGTGYSSLSYIKHFPIDTIKIDQSFVKGMLHSRNDAAIVSAIVSMANGLEVNLIAEGVEYLEQKIRLKMFGCTQVQGFLYSPALCSEALEDYINQNHRRSVIARVASKS